MGRTGEWWACEHEDVTPDAMPMAKAFGAGLPLSGTLYREELDTWGSGGHTGTFRGHNPAMRASLRAIEYIEEYDLLDRATELGEEMMAYLRDLDSPLVAEVRGRGLFVGVELVDEDGAPSGEMLSEVQTNCMENGVLPWAGGRADNVLRLMPPLVITREQMETGLDVIANAIEGVTEPRLVSPP